MQERVSVWICLSVGERESEREKRNERVCERERFRELFIMKDVRQLLIENAACVVVVVVVAALIPNYHCLG